METDGIGAGSLFIISKRREMSLSERHLSCFSSNRKMRKLSGERSVTAASQVDRLRAIMEK